MGQRLMQAAGDIFLGWQRIKGLDGVTRDYYVRQFNDWKGGADTENMLAPGATVYARICGAPLARAHARCGDGSRCRASQPVAAGSATIPVSRSPGKTPTPCTCPSTSTSWTRR